MEDVPNQEIALEREQAKRHIRGEVTMGGGALVHGLALGLVVAIASLVAWSLLLGDVTGTAIATLFAAFAFVSAAYVVIVWRARVWLNARRMKQAEKAGAAVQERQIAEARANGDFDQWEKP